ncbi:MAG: protein-disulfide reductase DsbD family protein [Acetobacteraceae bacterium]
MRRLLLAFALLLAAAPARAASGTVYASREARVALVSAVRAAPAGGMVDVGLFFRIAAGWHIYWRNAGDAGLAPQIALHLPAGATAGPIEWPAPRRMRQAGLMTYGYTGRVLLPFTVRVPAAGGLAVRAKAQWLICKDICIPEQASFALTLPPGPAAPSREAALFTAALRALPRPAPWAVHLAPGGRLWLRPGAPLAGAYFFAGQPGAVRAAGPQPLATGSGLAVLTLPLAKGFRPGAALSGVLRLHFADGREAAYAVTASPAALPARAPAPAGGLPFGRALLFAFLGGLILNLMPCVFPVLAMKALALARMSGAALREARISAAAYTAGVLVTFLGLAGVLLVLRAGGMAAGWGFQFTAPAFVVGMAWLLFAVGLGFSGLIVVGDRLAGAGQGLAARGGWVGSFFTGLLAVLVATPCTAPFMAAAIGAALAASAASTLGVFAALGAGFALPYAALAMSPGFARALPRPGRWMEVLRQALAFPMYGAAAWLLWVATAEAGPHGVAAGAAGMVLIGFAAWVLAAARADGARSDGAPSGGVRGRWLARGLALAALAGAVALLPSLHLARRATAGEVVRGIPYAPARLAALRAAGRGVFLDVTAAWCLTCQVNDRIALDRASVRQAFARRHIVFMVGDWTRQDPALTAYLSAHGREGVPLYVYYPPHRRGRELPQILTPGIVLAAITG